MIRYLKMKKTTQTVFFGLSILGLIDSIYLSYMNISQSSLVCNVLEGCNLVTQSEYAKLFSIPLAFLGVFFYCLIIITAIAFLFFKKNSYLKFLALVILIGFLFSLYFLYLQIIVIQALCTYCLISLGINFALLIFVIYYKKNIYRKDREVSVIYDKLI